MLKSIGSSRRQITGTWAVGFHRKPNAKVNHKASCIHLLDSLRADPLAHEFILRV